MTQSEQLPYYTSVTVFFTDRFIFRYILELFFREKWTLCSVYDRAHLTEYKA